MGKKQTVILYGNSLVIEGLAASLIGQPDLSLYQVHGDGTSMLQQLTAQPPDVVIFDLAADPPDNAFLLLPEHPHLLLIGVDLKHHQMLQWAGQCAPAQTAQDVVQAIQRWAELQGQ